MAHSYATETDYATWTGVAVAPSDTLRRLKRASAFVDAVLVGAVYPVDAAGLPTDADHVAALKDAVCAQVQFWAESGDVDGTGAAGLWDDVSIGSIRLARGTRAGHLAGNAAGSARQLAPLAHDALRAAGLLPVRPLVYG